MQVNNLLLGPLVHGAAHCTVSELIGTEVWNAKNEPLGEVHDIVLDRGNRRIAYLVLGVGGFFGMGERFLAIPWRIVEIGRHQGDGSVRAILAIDREALHAAPGFDKTRWPDLGDPAWATVVDEYYRYHGGPVRAAAPSELPRADLRGNAAFDRSANQGGFVHRRVSRILGTEVVDLQHRDLATVEDLVVEPRQATIDGAVLGFGGIIGIGERMALVPAEALTLDGDGDSFQLPCSRTQLEAMALLGGRWPVIDSDEWLLRARAQMAAACGEEAVEARSPEPPVALPDWQLPETVVGVVTTIGTLRTSGGGVLRVRFRVRTPAGHDVIVHAASADCEDQLALGLRTGKTVVVAGSRASHGTQTVLEATALTIDGRTAQLRVPLGIEAVERP